MAVDYRERRTVTAAKNRPRKQTISTAVIAFAVVILAAYGLGVATGWLFFRLSPKPVTVAKPANVQLPAPITPAGSENTGAPGDTQPVTATRTPPLTFYDTLPKGEKAVMGSGLNPRPVEPQPKSLPAKPGAPEKPAPVASPPQKANPPPVPEVTVPQQTSGAPVNRRTYAVQVASTKDKADAESIKARLATKWKATAYIVASQVKDKGTWYRVRVGHNLDEAKAKELAAALGRGAVMVPE